jgi:hypothetical protein
MLFSYFCFISPGEKYTFSSSFHWIFIPSDCGLEWRRDVKVAVKRTGRSGRKKNKSIGMNELSLKQKRDQTKKEGEGERENYK